MRIVAEFPLVFVINLVNTKKVMCELYHFLFIKNY